MSLAVKLDFQKSRLNAIQTFSKLVTVISEINFGTNWNMKVDFKNNLNLSVKVVRSLYVCTPKVMFFKPLQIYNP